MKKIINTDEKEERKRINAKKQKICLISKNMNELKKKYFEGKKEKKKKLF